MAQKISIGIDIGTKNVRVIVLQGDADSPARVVLAGVAESKGVKHGYITKVSDAGKSVTAVIKQIEKAFPGGKVPKVAISIGGTGLSGNVFQSNLPLMKGQMEVTSDDVARVSEAGRSDMPQNFAVNRRILHSFPLQYKLDGRVVQGRPHGLKGSRLECKTLFVTCPNHHANDIMESVEESGASIESLVSAPIARGNFLVSKLEKMAGVALLDIGFETSSLIVYDEGLPISIEVFQVGSNDITNDLALKLKTDLTDAEEVKRGMARMDYPKKKVDEIIKSRLDNIFSLVEDHLKKIGKNGLLPAGIVLCGGGAEVIGIESSAKSYLKIPARRVEERVDNGSRGQLKLSEWGAAYGAAIFSLSAQDEESFGMKMASDIGKRAGVNIWKWIKQFMP